MKYYAVSFHQEKVGQVVLRPNGRYFVLNCTCKLHSGGIHKLMAKGKGAPICIGTLYPRNGIHQIQCSLPMNALEGIEEYYIEKTEKVLIISEDMPIQMINRLENMRFRIQAGKPGVLITEDLIPDQRDNGRSRKRQHE